MLTRCFFFQFKLLNRLITACLLMASLTFSMALCTKGSLQQKAKIKYIYKFVHI